MSPEDLLHDLDESQRRAVTSPARPLAIVAPAGSGKTRVLTRRIAWRVASGDAEASHVLALTFTRKAAGELRERLSRLGLRDGVAAGTFHGIAFAQLRNHWASQGRRPPTLLARKGKVLGEVLRAAGRSSGIGPGELASEIEWAKARLFGPDGYAPGAAAAGRRAPAAPERIAELYASYEESKRHQGLVDFDDLLKLCSDGLQHDEAFAAAQRWRFRHLFVDEFQDVNPLQLGLLDAWRGGHHDLCVVGDPQQAIYGWNGADAGLLTEFRLRYRSAEIVSLDHNYRSTPQVLAAAAHVLRRARVDVAPARATQADGPVPRVLRYLTDVEEARAVARAIRDRRAPQMPWSAQAVLVRTHGQIALLTEGLRVAGIPHHVRGGAALLERDEVRAALRLVRGNDRPLAAMLPDLEALAAEAAADVVADDPAAEAESDLGPAAPAGTVADNLSAVVQLARDHLRLDRQSTGLGFYGWLVATLQAEGIDPAHHDAVTVATFHAAKGLEWPVVHLAGLEDGFVPIGHARTAADRAEEARLLYVAMTRALVGLSGTWAAQRTFNGKVVDRRVCPWLRDLPTDEDVRDPNRPASTADWQAHLADQRAQLAAASTTRTSPTLAALQAWRDEQAQAARVPPAAVVDDQLLEQLAELRPADQDELAAVPGMGPLLARRIGDGLLRALATAPRTNDRSA
ncbi:MAG: ATP-dependent DNA helicase UvrD2 [Acidimicrobiales bacterium]